MTLLIAPHLHITAEQNRIIEPLEIPVLINNSNPDIRLSEALSLSGLGTFRASRKSVS